MENQPTPSMLPPKKTKESFQTKTKTYEFIKDAILMIVSSFLVSFSAHSLIAPNKFAIGGVSGIAILVEETLRIPQSITVSSINFPLLIIAFFIVKKRFAIMSFINVAFQSLWLVALIERPFFPVFEFEEKIFGAITGGIGVGTGIAIAFKSGGSTGGMDIVGTIIQKKGASLSIPWILFSLNCIVITSSFFVYKNLADTAVGKVLPLIMAASEQFVESKVNDTILSGLASAIEYRIITDKPQELSYALIMNLGRGVTRVSVQGMYTGDTHSMVICVINRRQINAIRRVIKQVDPDSFAVTSKVSNVMGLGFYTSD